MPKFRQSHEYLVDGSDPLWRKHDLVPPIPKSLGGAQKAELRQPHESLGAEMIESSTQKDERQRQHVCILCKISNRLKSNLQPNRERPIPVHGTESVTRQCQ